MIWVQLTVAYFLLFMLLIVLVKKLAYKEDKAMMNLNDLKKENLINLIDWDMTPDEAVKLYLEWGNNWASGNYVIRSKDDVSHYFVVNTWEETPIIYLIRRNSEEAVELAKIDMPNEIKDHFLKKNGNLKGVYPIEGEVKNWLKKQLDFEA